MKNYKTIEEILVGSLVKKGKKQLSVNIVDKAFTNASEKLNLGMTEILMKITLRLGLIVELRTIRIRRNSHNVPFVANTKRRNYLIVKKLLKAVKLDVTKRPFVDKLTDQIIETVIKKKIAQVL